MNMNAGTRTFGRSYCYNRYVDGPHAYRSYTYPYSPIAPIAPVAQASVTK